MVVFLALVLAPAAALGWFAWKAAGQDIKDERLRIHERHQQAADLIVTTLDQKLTAVQQQLSDPAKAASEVASGARVVVLGVRESLPEAPESLFEAGEADEFRLRDFPAAIARFKALAQDADSAVRAGALFRLGRNLRNAKRLSEALAVYADLALIHDAAVRDGLPADLVASHARCGLLFELGRSADLQREAAELRTDLDRGRWLLDGPTYVVYANDAREWLGPDPEDTALIQAADALWMQWRSAADTEEAFSGRQLLASVGTGVLLWRTENERLALFAARARYVDSVWLASVTPLLQSQGVVLALGDAGNADVTRAAAETSLPWSVGVSSADPDADLAPALKRRQV